MRKFIKKYLPILTMLCLFLMPISAADAAINASTSTGTGTVTMYYGQGLTAVHLEWTSTSGGAVTTTITGLSGTIERLAFAPVASASPSANYDIVVEDLNDIDLSQGEGTNLSATLAADAVPLISETIGGATTHHKVPIVGPIDIKVTNAGASKQGTMTIIVSH